MQSARYWSAHAPLGSVEPEHYPIPAFVTRNRARYYDPSAATKSWRTAWRKLTVGAGLKRLRGHDRRHRWVTGHAEAGTPKSVLEAQTGHLSKRMSDHYKRVSERAAHKAAQELARVKSGPGAAARAKPDSVQSSVQTG
jgi:integrase